MWCFWGAHGSPVPSLFCNDVTDPRRLSSRSKRIGSNPRLLSSTIRKAFWMVSCTESCENHNHKARSAKDAEYILKLEKCQKYVLSQMPNAVCCLWLFAVSVLLEGSSNSHHLAHTLHGGANASIHRGKLLEIPSWHLCHHIVQGWLEACSGAACDAVPVRSGRC